MNQVILEDHLLLSKYYLVPGLAEPGLVGNSILGRHIKDAMATG